MNAVIALAGNPNSGKTTLFNELTGARQHVGNYPGVTVEKRQGIHVAGDRRLTIVDLPGTYSLTAYSLEEVVARDFLVSTRPQAVVNIVDAANLERNLYLSLQFLEMGLPLCIALNMMDVAHARGVDIDQRRLAELLKVPVIPTVARIGKGKQPLIDAAVKLAGSDAVQPLDISYGADVDQALADMQSIIEIRHFLTGRYRSRWVALKYLEKDRQMMDLGRQTDADVDVQLRCRGEKLADHLQATGQSDPEAVIADQRYGYIRSLMKQGVIRRRIDSQRLFVSDRIDKVVTHRWLGPAIMLAVIWLLYQFTFSYSEVPIRWLDSGFGLLSAGADRVLPDGLVKSMVISGIIDGVGGVLGFVPLIVFMFLGIAFLEDSGYLARVAFMMDRVLRIFGLHGSSVMAFIVSGGIAGGCAVPGVMATRTLKSRRERLATLLTVPFMNCGAKLPVFALLVGAFFARHAAVVMFAITIGAWVGALLIAKLLRSTVIRGESTPFVMELPPYRWPTLKGLLIHTWERTWQYARKAGKVILAISIILWAMMTFPRLPETVVQSFDASRQAIEATMETPASPTGAEIAQLAGLDAARAEAALRHSMAGRIGIALESVSRWAGFDWRTNIALVGGFAAKEVVVSTLGTAYSLGEVDPENSNSLSRTLAAAPGWRPLTALSLILFVMFYSPCVVAVICIAKEAGSWRWGVFAIGFNTALAFGLAAITFQVGAMLGF